MQTRVWVRKPAGRPAEIASFESYEPPCHHCHQQVNQCSGDFAVHNGSLIFLKLWYSNCTGGCFVCQYNWLHNAVDTLSGGMRGIFMRVV